MGVSVRAVAVGHGLFILTAAKQKKAVIRFTAALLTYECVSALIMRFPLQLKLYINLKTLS